MAKERPLRLRIEAAITDWEKVGYISYRGRRGLVFARERLPRPIDVVLSREFAGLALANLDTEPGDLVRDVDVVQQWLGCLASKFDVADRLSSLTIPNYPPLHAAAAACNAMLRSVTDETTAQKWDLFFVDLAARQAHISQVLASKQAAAYSVAKIAISEQREGVSPKFAEMIREFLRSQLNDATAIALLEDYEAGDEDARGAWFDRITENGVSAALSSSVAKVFVI